MWSKWRRNRGGSDGAGSAPRSLEQLFKQVEKSTQVRRTGLDKVLAELQMHRDATTDPEARSALAWLCNSLSRFVNNPSAAHARQLVMATGTAKAALHR
ncbi:hypothetical protein [Mycobacterium simiae]|uniref:Uncharacterized protein n=1 Tax=Mycobacterium simiae TaxID=1784 RepID=A0A1X0Y6C7_MYCSI|nr:hypothetical protein [Mycobacterium simiae]ORJ60705.1 hypothetical protein B5M45_10435 [Mycobacterium simiae]PLV47795.1 hypothetical protein X011_18365 [Mycobacterium tuberculosis variant microti OV254]BBX39959.1 hypothetical protein MSIM_14100 [Mycobacterium simiae]